jgi:hypothetical protein
MISLLCRGDEMIRWRSITALGHVVSQMSSLDFEAARVVMRRLMWHLNDESGGIGWGAPEAMAEIMARDPQLADVYAGILVSYIDPEGNFLEHPGLQRGVLWGIGRLGHIGAHWVLSAAALIPPFFSASDPFLRGLAVWAGAALNLEALWQKIRFLANDTAKFDFFLENQMITLSVANMVVRMSFRRKTGVSPELLSP